MKEHLTYINIPPEKTKTLIKKDPQKVKLVKEGSSSTRLSFHALSIDTKWDLQYFENIELINSYLTN